MDAAIISSTKSSTNWICGSSSSEDAFQRERSRFRTFSQNLGQLHCKGCCLAVHGVVDCSLETKNDGAVRLGQDWRPTQSNFVLVSSTKPSTFQRLPLFCAFQGNFILNNGPGIKLDASVVSRIAERSRFICWSSFDELSFKSYGVLTGSTRVHLEWRLKQACQP